MNRKLLILTLVIALFGIILSGCGGSVYNRFMKEPLDYSGENPPKLPKDHPLMIMIAEAGDRDVYPDADVITIVDVDSVVYDSIGTFDSYNYSLTKILTMKEAKEMSELPIGYDSQVMELDIMFVRVIKKDGTVLTVSDSSIIDETMPGYSEQDIFWSNLRQRTIHMPKLSMGDAVEIAIRHKGLTPYFEGIFDGNHSFQSSDPLLLSRAVLMTRKNLPLNNWKVFNDEEGKVLFTEEEQKDYFKYVWEGKDFEPLVMEPGVQPLDVATFVLYSSTTWEELSRKAYEISIPNMQPGPEIIAKVKELTADKKTEYEKIMALHYFVAQEIRYIGVSLGGKEGITPHDVNETFKNRGGVCKDKSALLTVMLLEAGVEAFDALTHPQAPVFSEVAANQFMHMVVVARMKDGKEIFLDVTDEFCRTGLPGYYSGRGYLMMSEKGEDIKYIPLIPAEENIGRIEGETKIDENGKLTSTVVISGEGIYDEVMRSLQMLDQSDRKRLFDRLVGQIHPAAEVTNWKIEPEPLKNLWVPASMTIEYEIQDFAIMAGDYLLLKSPVSEGKFDLMVGAYLTQFTTLEEREHPFETMFTMALDLNETIEIPEGYTTRVMPDPINAKEDIGYAKAEYKLDGNTISFNASVRVNEWKIQPEQYEGFRNIAKEYSKAGDGQVILVKKGDVK